MFKIQSLIQPNEDALVFSLLVRRNVGATQSVEIETLDENGNTLVQTQSVDASRPEPDVIDAALNAVVSSFNKAGFVVRANASPIVLNENPTDAATAKLVIDVSCRNSTSDSQSVISSERETLENSEV